MKSAGFAAQQPDAPAPKNGTYTSLDGPAGSDHLRTGPKAVLQLTWCPREGHLAREYGYPYAFRPGRQLLPKVDRRPGSTLVDDPARVRVSDPRPEEDLQSIRRLALPCACDSGRTRTTAHDRC